MTKTLTSSLRRHTAPSHQLNNAVPTELHHSRTAVAAVPPTLQQAQHQHLILMCEQLLACSVAGGFNTAQNHALRVACKDVLRRLFGEGRVPGGRLHAAQHVLALVQKEASLDRHTAAPRLAAALSIWATEASSLQLVAEKAAPAEEW
jgi:hypothetical protein